MKRVLMQTSVCCVAMFVACCDSVVAFGQQATASVSTCDNYQGVFCGWPSNRLLAFAPPFQQVNRQVNRCYDGSCDQPPHVSSPSSAAPEATGSLGSSEYATILNYTPFIHDRNWRGYEVIYWNSSGATESAARRAWMQSPGHRSLLVQGCITEVACVGKACVGRGVVAGSRVVGAVSQPLQKHQPVRRFCRRLFR